MSSANITGKDAETLLDKINITVNKNTIPNETQSAMVASGIRIGSPAMTSRGLKEKDFVEIARIIDSSFKNRDDEKELEKLKNRVKAITTKYPLWYK